MPLYDANETIRQSFYIVIFNAPTSSDEPYATQSHERLGALRHSRFRPQGAPQHKEYSEREKLAVFCVARREEVPPTPDYMCDTAASSGEETDTESRLRIIPTPR
ncbi:hypothetical protein EYF80_033555 [Liparis tanakae]|uniref:Uncharacterized protein n=1 Tax=Liparis tanakae TaxID=230148 RepID=A0A4Z2GU70_9TELE|nr:hypothetical protein EYF80_033555 [Liparis tanakae]